MGADQAGRPGADDDDVALDQLIEFFVVFARDVAGDVAFAQGCWFWSYPLLGILAVDFCSGFSNSSDFSFMPI